MTWVQRLLLCCLMRAGTASGRKDDDLELQLCQCEAGARCLYTAAAAFDDGLVEQFDDIFCTNSAVLSLCALRLSYDHLQSPRSHSDNHIVHTAITHSTEQVIVQANLCALFDTQFCYWQFGLTGFSWFPLVTPDEFE